MSSDSEWLDSALRILAGLKTKAEADGRDDFADDLRLAELHISRAALKASGIKIQAVKS